MSKPTSFTPKLPPSLAMQTRGPLDATVECPGSKSITNRAVVIAALAKGETLLENPLESEDTWAIRNALTLLGAKFHCDGARWRVEGTNGTLVAPTETLDATASGTAARFLTAVATLAPGPSVLDGTVRMRERPIQDLVDALTALGAQIEVTGQNGCPPLRILGGKNNEGLRGGRVTVDASRSSQYVSAILLVAPYAREDVRIRLKDSILVSRPYVDVTLHCMREFGAEASWTADGEIRITAGATYTGRNFAIEPDASTAAYFFAAAAITRGRVRVLNIPANSAQADLRLLRILEAMGCKVVREKNWIEVHGPVGALRPIDVDMNEMPDGVLAVAVTCLFANGRSVIRNVGNLRIKETDRLAALETELRKLGARAEASKNSLVIEPGQLHGAEIDTYDDHRMAMAFALAGFKIPGVVIRNPSCVAKSWPEYFSAIAKL